MLLAASLGCKPGFEVSGRRVAEGNFSTINLAATPDGRAFILALKDPDDTGGQLTVIPFGGGESCDSGRAGGYFVLPRVFFTGDVSLPLRDPRIGIFGSDGDTSAWTLRFGDLSCGGHGPVMEGLTDIPQVYAIYEADWDVSGLIVWAASGEVYQVDQWNETSTLLAAGVTQIEVDYFVDYRLWMIESGQLVVREKNGTEIARFGSTVTALSLLSLPDGTEAAYVDAEGMHIIEDIAVSPVLVETDACRPEYLGPARMLAYMYPCLDRRLVVMNRDTGESAVYDVNVAAVKRVDAFPGEDWVFYVTGVESGETVGDLWAVPPGGSPLHVASDTDLLSIDFVIDDSFFVLAGFDGEKGSFGRWSLTEGFTEVQRDVAQILYGQGRIAVLADYDVDVGNLFLYDRADLALELSASGVPKNRFRFSSEAMVMGYLDRYDVESRSGRLRVWIIPLSQVVDVQEDGVSEFMEILWPGQGVLFTVRHGDEAGIYFASVEMVL